MKIEYRVFAHAEVRAKKDGKGIEGYAAVFNQRSENLGGFREAIMPGAFSRMLREKQDVRAMFNHDPNMLLGRCANSTLRMAEDSTGLSYDCDMPDTSVARDVYRLIERRDITGCSFSFVPADGGQRWSEGRDTETGEPIAFRDLTDLDVRDVGPVTFPAYPQTSVDSRMLWPQGEPAEVLAYLIGEGRSDNEPYGNVDYADPGYQSDKKKRYPLDTEEHIRAAWNYIHQEKNAKKYSAEQLSHIKSKIVAAWKEKIDKAGPPSAEEKSAVMTAEERARLQAQLDMAAAL